MAVSVEKKKLSKKSAAKPKLEIKSHFFKNENKPEASPYDTVEWGIRNAVAGDFEQKGVEAPVCWSDSAVGIVAKLYFATINGKRENSIKTLIQRVVTKITDEGINHGYFVEKNGYNKDALIFENELAYILLHQIAAFNSPVWFNFGVPGRKQSASACYLLNVEDCMFGDDSITEWISNESIIFKSGAGSGVNLSKLRGSMEPLSTGGISSGPVSFMRVADANCASIKAGNTRRGAKLVCLDVDHPDILDFIDSKVREDERMRALMVAGVNLDPSTPEGEKNIAECTSFQNANISVRLSDDFMTAVEEDGDWHLTKRTTGEIIEDVSTSPLPARKILRDIAEAAWKCADPGVIFDDTVNAWHTTPSLGRINTSNPCNEVVTNDNSSCNLSSMNLVKFLYDDNSFRFDDFYHTVDIMITAMDITCSFSELPTKKLEENTRNLRQLGLGYSNLGAALMIQGIPYDSDDGRDWAASITSLMTARAYRRSAELASSLGDFFWYKHNYGVMGSVIQKHMNACQPGIIIAGEKSSIETNKIWHRALKQWDYIATNHDSGYRNSQVTVIAPCGTISFYMDCDTTGAEPLFAPVTYKKFASGGMMKQEPYCYKIALQKYDDDSIFQTASGINSISCQGHLDMIAAIQPHISGAISKTVNIPNDITVDDIYNIYLEGWKKGIKCLSVYRDGSKATQVLSTKKDTDAQNSPDDKNPSVLQFEAMGVAEKEDEAFKELENRIPWSDKYYKEKLKKEYEKSRQVGNRRRMNDERKSVTHKFSIGQHEGYITAGMYEDGTLGEIFLSGIGKQGSTLRGMMDAWAVAVSLGLQYGVPLEVLADKFSHMRFEPEGFTTNPEIKTAHSIPDYMMKWLISKFGDDGYKKELGIYQEDYVYKKDDDSLSVKYFKTTGGKICVCGAIMNRTGTCYTCSSCGANTGCG